MSSYGEVLNYKNSSETIILQIRYINFVPNHEYKPRKIDFLNLFLTIKLFRMSSYNISKFSEELHFSKNSLRWFNNHYCFFRSSKTIFSATKSHFLDEEFFRWSSYTYHSIRNSISKLFYIHDFLWKCIPDEKSAAARLWSISLKIG